MNIETARMLRNELSDLLLGNDPRVFKVTTVSSLNANHQADYHVLIGVKDLDDVPMLSVEYRRPDVIFVLRERKCNGS